MMLFFSILFTSQPFRLYALKQELDFSCVQPSPPNMCYVIAVYGLPRIIRINGVNRQNRALTAKRLNLLCIATVL